MSYICMTRVDADGASPLRPIGAKLTACPTCGATCWDKELPAEMAEIVGLTGLTGQGEERGSARKVCTECAIRRVGRPAGRSYVRPGRTRGRKGRKGRKGETAARGVKAVEAAGGVKAVEAAGLEDRRCG